MSRRLRQVALCDAHVAAEIDAYMKRPCSRARADGLTAMQVIRADARSKALAAAEWAAMDRRGNLPADWPERRAKIEAQFALKESRHV